MFKHTIHIGSIALLLASAAALCACGLPTASATEGLSAMPFQSVVRLIEYPAPQPPFDETRITPVETVGAAANE